MNQTNLLHKLAPLGVAVFGAISFTGIAVVPAQAAVFPDLLRSRGLVIHLISLKMQGMLL